MEAVSSTSSQRMATIAGFVNGRQQSVEVSEKTYDRWRAVHGRKGFTQSDLIMRATIAGVRPLDERSIVEALEILEQEVGIGVST